MDFGTGIVLLAGTMTFANEWYQTGKVNFRVPIATVLLAGAIGFLGRIDNRVSNALGVMIFIGAGSTQFNGHSAFGTLAQLFGGANQPAKSTPVNTQQRVRVA
jgi:hypothetical protein